MGHFPQNEVNYTKQPQSNFQPHFGKCLKQPQAEMKNGVAYKKKKCVLKIVWSRIFSSVVHFWIIIAQNWPNIPNVGYQKSVLSNCINLYFHKH